MAGGLVALLGLPLTLYSLAHLRNEPAVGGQKVANVQVGGSVDLVRNVDGNVGIGVRLAPAAEPAADHPRKRQPGGQSVTKSRIEGPAHLIDGVGGDLEISG
ncbi:hypothetical protein [Actinoplanes sp. NPDC089786]|uniref:hypothetical protein n=1 Tax=Actinoplanes sp. NPDC089786 TaxID=3155185 RepID=UPI0034413A65